jgi:hypothetical protein
MGPKAKSGPGRAQRKGISEGRTTKPASASTSRVGRYTPPEESGRYTRPIPKNVRRSARWFGPAILFLMLFGILMILLNYLTVLPGSVSVWYLVSGLVIIFAAFMMATRYR